MGFVYRYANDVPPAPFVLVIVSRPDGAASEPDWPARVDTGADRTVIPADVAARLALDEVGTGEGPRVDIAVDPLEGTTICAKDMPNALAVLAVAAVANS